MNNPNPPKIGVEEKLEEFEEFFGDTMEQFFCCAGHDCNCGDKEILPSALKWLREALTTIHQQGVLSERERCQESIKAEIAKYPTTHSGNEKAIYYLTEALNLISL